MAPWAKLNTPEALKISTKPSATNDYSMPVIRPPNRVSWNYAMFFFLFCFRLAFLYLLLFSFCLLLSFLRRSSFLILVPLHFFFLSLFFSSFTFSLFFFLLFL